MSEPVDPTPELDPEPDPELDPDQARIRALLAEHGSAAVPGAPEAMPNEVIARLQDAVALLAAERAQDVVPLAPRRARRWAPRGLVAAAAVVAIGLGGAAVGGLGGFPGLSGSDEATFEGGSTGDKGLAESGVSPQDDNGGAAVPEDGALDGAGSATLALPSLSSATFAQDARGLVASGALSEGTSPRRSTAEAGSPSASPDPSPTAGSSSEEPSRDSSAGSPADSSAPGVMGSGCAGPDLGTDRDQAGTTVTQVLLDGALTALVVRPPESGTRLVEAWSCDGETRLATARVSP